MRRWLGLEAVSYPHPLLEAALKETLGVIVWQEQVLQVAHALAAHRLVPESRLEVFPDAGHFPHLDDPLRFVRLLTDFVETTEPAQIDAGGWRQLLRPDADDAGG